MAAKDKARTVALVGNISEQELSQLAEALRAHSCSSGLTILPARNPLRWVDGVEVIRHADAVVLVEKQGTSTYTDVEAVCQLMKLFEKRVLGIVFSDVDALDG